MITKTNHFIMNFASMFRYIFVQKNNEYNSENNFLVIKEGTIQSINNSELYPLPSWRCGCFRFFFGVLLPFFPHPSSSGCCRLSSCWVVLLSLRFLLGAFISVVVLSPHFFWVLLLSRPPPLGGAAFPPTGLGGATFALCLFWFGDSLAERCSAPRTCL